MKTLIVTLKQHTPLIHFQPGQYGATLRASEVKPKLDRFILEKLGKEEFEEAKRKKWLIGKGDHPALNYKMRIESEEKKNKSSRLRLEIVNKSGGKKSTKDFPLLLANMGGRDNADDLVNFSMYESIKMILSCRNESLYDELKKLVHLFIANTNFGQRSNKGFGSFTVEKIEDCSGKKFYGFGGNYIKDCVFYMNFCLKENVENDDAVYSLSEQRMLFKVVNEFWSKLRKSINADTDVKCECIDSVQSYIKGMKFVERDDNVQRMPAPILFKPISYIDDGNLYFAIYVMSDTAFLEKLKNQYKDGEKLTSENVLYVNKIRELRYIDEFSNGLIHPVYDNWRVGNRDKSVDVEFYE